MNDKISPKYQMKLVANVERAIWAEFETKEAARFYISRWYETDRMDWENFTLRTDGGGQIELTETLHGIDGETLLKIAIDLGVETPDFIPSIPQFRNELKKNYKTASESFEKAVKHIEEHPDVAIVLANSTLERILKEILKDERVPVDFDKTMTLKLLTDAVLKEFKMFPNSDLPLEIRNIGSSFLSVNQNIEKLRSEKTASHGKTEGDYVISDSMYAYFVVNSIATVGLFLNSFYKLKYSPKIAALTNQGADDLPF